MPRRARCCSCASLWPVLSMAIAWPLLPFSLALTLLVFDTAAAKEGGVLPVPRVIALGPERTADAARYEVAAAAKRLRHGMPVAEALRLVTVPQEAAASAGDLLLSRHGVRTALDLQLVAADGAESEELLVALKESGLSLGDRAKIHLLFGPQQRRDSELVAKYRAGEHDESEPVRGLHLPRQQGRMLQAAAEGLSTDTAAIMLSVLVGAAGYLVQAVTARRAERAATERAHEAQAAERTRQREHEQMMAQIHRTEVWLDKCCRPIAAGLQHIYWSRVCFLQETVERMEAFYADVVTEMQSSPMMMFKVDDDGCVRSKRSGVVHWDPKHELRSKLTRVYSNMNYSAPTAAALAIRVTDGYSAVSQPYCDEAPRHVLDVVAAEPTGATATDWRRYARTVLVPLVTAVAENLVQHSATIEWPPMSWLIETFDDERNFTMGAVGNTLFGDYWVAYSASWVRVLAEWDAGAFNIARPALPQPFGGLQSAIMWSLKQGEIKQNDLIGMAAEAEFDVAEFSNLISSYKAAASGDLGDNLKQ